MNSAPPAGLILAAGRGSRLGSLTSEKPKCLIHLAGKTLLEWQVSCFLKTRITDLAIVCGYKSSQITDRRLVRIMNPIWNRSNMVYSLLCADSWLSRRATIVSYGDIVFHPQFIEQLRQSEKDIVICYDILWRELWQERFEDPTIDAESFVIRDGRVSKIGQKGTPVDEIEGQYLGLFRITPAAWIWIRDYLKSLDESLLLELDVTTLFGQLIESGYEIHGIPIRGQWCEIDIQSDLTLYQNKIRSGVGWNHDWRFQR